jgi:hypothetical protein
VTRGRHRASCKQQTCNKQRFALTQSGDNADTNGVEQIALFTQVEGLSHPGAQDDVVPQQLTLIDLPEPAPWELDDRTRAVGRHGVAQARAALNAARAAQQGDTETSRTAPRTAPRLLRPLPAAAETARRLLASRPAPSDGTVIRIDQLAS